MYTDRDLHVLAQLGRIAANHSFLQLILEGVVWEICELDRERGEAVTGGMSFRVLADTAFNLADLRYPDSPFRELFASRVDRANELRDRFLHSRWLFPLTGPESDAINRLFGLDSDAVRAKYARRQGRVIAESVSLDTITEAAGSIESVALDVAAWLDQLIPEGETLERVSANLLRQLESRGFDVASLLDSSD